ncbi:hypothetical protein ACSQ67_026394 [Phaseolus vulgaris]
MNSDINKLKEERRIVVEEIKLGKREGSTSTCMSTILRVENGSRNVSLAKQNYSRDESNSQNCEASVRNTNEENARLMNIYNEHPVRQEMEKKASQERVDMLIERKENLEQQIKHLEDNRRS